MGDVEISMDEEKSSEGEHEQRKSPCPPLPEGCERHREAEQVKCSCWAVSADEVSFNRLLRRVFIIIISVVAMEILLFDRTIKWVLQWSIVFAAMLAIVLTVNMFMKTIMAEIKLRTTNEEKGSAKYQRPIQQL